MLNAMLKKTPDLLLVQLQHYARLVFTSFLVARFASGSKRGQNVTPM